MLRGPNHCKRTRHRLPGSLVTNAASHPSFYQDHSLGSRDPRSVRALQFWSEGRGHAKACGCWERVDGVRVPPPSEFPLTHSSFWKRFQFPVSSFFLSSPIPRVPISADIHKVNTAANANTNVIIAVPKHSFARNSIHKHRRPIQQGPPTPPTTPQPEITFRNRLLLFVGQKGRMKAHTIHLSTSMEKPKRFRANSISGRLRSLSELIEEGMIETRQKVHPLIFAHSPHRSDHKLAA